MSRPNQIVAQSQISIPEDDYEEQLPPNRCAKILYYTWKFCSCIFSHLIMITLVIAYCLIGAYTFQRLELEHEMEVKKSIRKIRENMTEAIWTITEESLVLHERNWTDSVTDKLKLFEEDILIAMKRRGWDGNEEAEKQQWTFAGSLFYSIIVITTIGYGHIAPKTQMGKVVTIFYAILGIPLMLLCLSNIGDVMASSFRFLYWRVFCYMCTRKPKRKSRHKSLSRQGSRSLRGRSQSVRRRTQASIQRAHSDTDCRYKDDSYVSPASTRLAKGARGERGQLRSESHTPGGYLEVPNLGSRDVRRSPSNRSPSRQNAYGDKTGSSRLAMPLDDINDDSYGVNPTRIRKARPGDLRSRSLPRPQRVELNPAGKRVFSERSHPRPNPRNYDQEYHPQRQSDYEMRDDEEFRMRTDKIDRVIVDDLPHVEKRDMFDRYGTGGRGRRLDRIVSMDPEYYVYDRRDGDIAYESNRGRRATSQYEYRDMEYEDEDFEPRRRYGRYPKDDFRNHYDDSPDRIPGLDDYDMGQWRSRAPPRRDDPVGEEWQSGNRLPRFDRSPRTDHISRNEFLSRADRLPFSDRLPSRGCDRNDDEFEEGMPHIVDCWSEDEDINDFVPSNNVRRLPPAIKAAVSPRMMTPLGLRVSRQTPASAEEPPRAFTTSHNGTISDYPATYNKEQIKPVPIWLCVCLVISYIIAGAYLFHNWENWPLLDSAYFCFITLTTIGFGDFVPAQAQAQRDEDAQLRIALCSLYLLFGISLLAMSFNLVQEEVIANIKSVAKRLGIIKPEIGEESDDN